MTVANQIYAVSGAGNGVARIFSFSPMVIHDDDELEVITRVIATGVETERTLGTGSTNYSIDITTYPATGSISFPANGGTLLPSTEEIFILRKLTIEQLEDLQSRGGYFPETQERQLDKMVMYDLQQQGELDRSLHLPRGVPTTVLTEIETPIGNGSKFLRLKSDLTGFEWAELSSTTSALSDASPQATDLETPAAGTSDDISRADHVHAIPPSVLATRNLFLTTHIL